MRLRQLKKFQARRFRQLVEGVDHVRSTNFMYLHALQGSPAEKILGSCTDAGMNVLSMIIAWDFVFLYRI
jgi:hypothetical protein